MKALYQNKIGDYSLVIGLIVAIAVFSDLSLGTIFSLAAYLNGDLLFILCLSFLGAAAAKSAMVGLHNWLFQAMEGPTSVSALQHSSTMVTAGVVLLIRISPILEFSSTTLMIIVWLGSLGSQLGAAFASTEVDIKKIIAASTLSQLGYMIVAVGISQHSQALFHLLTHAFFEMTEKIYYYPVDGPSFGNRFKRYQLTYYYFKFEFYLWQKRLTKVNLCKNCVIVLKISHISIKIIQGKIIDGLYVNYGRKIGGILTLSISNLQEWLFIELQLLEINIIIKKPGKPGKLEKNSADIKGLSYSLLTLNNLYYFKINGCKNFIKQKASSNVEDRFEEFYIIPISTSPRGCRIKMSSKKRKSPLLYPKTLHSLGNREVNSSYCNYNNNPLNYTTSLRHKILKKFKIECKALFKLHLDKYTIHHALILLIDKYLYHFQVLEGQVIDDKILSFLAQYIKKRYWIWAQSKHHKVSKTAINKKYFNPDNTDLPIFSNTFNYIRTRFLVLNKLKYLRLSINNNFIWSNLEDPSTFQEIRSALKNSGPLIYAFWSNLNPYKTYIGSSEEPLTRSYINFVNKLRHSKIDNPKLNNSK